MLVALAVANADAAEKKVRVCLDRSENMAVPIKGKVSQSLWSREVIRQALLIAARSEMKLLAQHFFSVASERQLRCKSSPVKGFGSNYVATAL